MKVWYYNNVERQKTIFLEESKMSKTVKKEEKKVLNTTNFYAELVQQNKAQEDYFRDIIIDSVTELKKNNYAILTNWEQVETVLDCFYPEDTENWDFKEFKNVFIVIPDNISGKIRKRLERLLNAKIKDLKTDENLY